MCAACAFSLEKSLGHVNGRPLRNAAAPSTLALLPPARKQEEFEFSGGHWTDPDWTGEGSLIEVRQYRKRKLSPKEEAQARERREPLVARIYDEE